MNVFSEKNFLLLVGEAGLYRDLLGSYGEACGK